MQSAEKGETAGKLLEPGDMFGDYTVEKLLGKGGMGAVYLVRAPDGERYAVKLMFPEIASKNPDFRKRFAREAEFAMKIRHKNLISVYDVGEDPDTGYCYIIMDYVPGGSVKERLAANGALPIPEAVSIAAQIALALEVAHRHGVIHRDIKPDNIMFDADGTPKLADLGVAKFTDDEHKTTVTTTGMIIGTPAYMAPEQMMDSHHIDARADIYALGIVLYEMLTGKRPTAGSTAVELLAKALKGEALPDVRTMRPEVSAAVAHVLSLMCAPKPEGRPATALETAHMLQAAAMGKLVLPKKLPRSSEALARKKKRRAVHVAAEVALAIFVSALAVYGIVCYSGRGAAKAGEQKINTPQTREPRVGGRKSGTDATREMPTAESYVQNGLLAMWDGIENAGKGRHDPYAKVWKNLAGGPDAVPVDGLAAWSDNSALFGIGRYYRVDTLFGKPQKVTVEVCHRAFPAPAGDFSGLFSSCQSGGIGLQGNTDSCWLACVANPAGGYYSEVRLPALRGKAETLAFTADMDFIVYRDANPLSRVSGITGIRYNDKYGFQIGRDPGNTGDIAGEIYSIRLYSRPLAADELRRNHEIDCVRFGLDRVTPTPSSPAATGSEGKTTALFPRLDRAPKAWAYSFKEEQGWYRRDFDDSRWTRAQGGFGAKITSTAYGIARMNTHWDTKRIFLRRHFSWAGGDISRVVADIFHDNGVNLYLNGLPIVSFYGRTSDWIPREIPLEDFAKALKVGDNVFCAEVTNDRLDQYFDCGLIVECGGHKKTSPDAATGIRRVATKAGTWTIRVGNGVAKIGDGRNIALDPQPKGALTIPAELDGFPIRALARDCFKRCNGLESVTIPEGVLFVEQGAFYECRRLSAVSLPGSLEYLGGGPFHESQITQIDLKNVRLMAKDALRGCGKLERVNVASGNQTYREADGIVYDKVRRAVVFCPRSRTSYTFPDGIEEVSGYAFQRCSIRDVEIPASVKGVGDSAFSECPFLESVRFHGTDVDLDDWSFGHNPRLKTIVLPSRQKSLDANAIFSCAGQLESVDLPNTVETIGARVFENCPRLKRINLGKSLRVCRFRAFASCPELRELAFPEKLAELTSSIFLNCRSLSKVFFDGNAPALVDNGKNLFGGHVFKNTDKSLVAYVREGSTGWIDATSKLPDVWPAAGGEWARPIRRSGTLAASDRNTSVLQRGPDLLKERGITPPVLNVNGRDARSPSANGQDVRSPSIEPFKLLSERPKPLTIKLVKGEQLELMGCPAGTFTMGYEGGVSHHTPHQVTISRPFWAGKYPVTRAQWDIFMPPRKLDEIEIALGGPKGAVSLVRRREVDEYCNLLTKRYRSLLPKGYVFRLPTIAESEYFWRTDSQDANDPYAKSQKLTNEERVSIAVGDDGKKDLLKRKGVAWKDIFSIPSRTPSVEVGLRRSNAWGLYDLAGNVDQWLLDVFPSAKATAKVNHVKDLPWSNKTDPLFWSAEGVEGTGVYCESRKMHNWTELALWYGMPGLRWRSLGFRIVAGPDLVSERHGKGLPASAEQGGTQSIEVFPHADAQTAKWKKRAPWRYTTKVPPTDWAEPTFSDGKWKRTNKPVGFGKDVAFMRMADKWTTSDIWLRRHFTWKTAKATRVVFEIYHDEDVEIYLNGTNIFNKRGWNHGWEPCEVPVETFTSAVREGDNVLAVKVHDSAAPRYFDCGLTVEVEESK